MEYVNYEPREDLCSAACSLGKKLKVPVYQFLKESLIRKYGTEFYEALEATALHQKVKKISMSETAASFIAKSTIKAADLEHRRKINFNISKYNAVVPIGKSQFTDVNITRERAKNIKWEAIENLDKYLLEFEKKLQPKVLPLFGPMIAQKH